MTDNSEHNSVLDFFGDKEAIGLIARINRDEGNIKRELRQKLDISGKSLRNLLDAAIDADLIKENRAYPDDHGRATRFELTDRGRDIQRLLRNMGLDDVYREYMARKEKLEEVIAKTKERIERESLHEENFPRQEWERSEPYSSEELEQLAEELSREEKSMDQGGQDAQEPDSTDANSGDVDEEESP